MPALQPLPVVVAALTHYITSVVSQVPHKAQHIKHPHWSKSWVSQSSSISSSVLHWVGRHSRIKHLKQEVDWLQEQDCGVWPAYPQDRIWHESKAGLATGASFRQAPSITPVHLLWLSKQIKSSWRSSPFWKSDVTNNGRGNIGWPDIPVGHRAGHKGLRCKVHNTQVHQQWMLFGELSTVAEVHLLSFSLLDTVNRAYKTEY